MRIRLAAIVAAVVLAITFVPGPSAGITADGPCPNGSNWDNIAQLCR